MREITVGTMANEPGKSKVANSGCPGLCLLRGVTDLEGYLKLHMLLGEQNAKPGVVPTCVGPPEGGRTYTYRRLPCAAEKRHPRTSLVRRAQTFLLRLVRGSSVKIAVASAGSGSVRLEIGRRDASMAQAVSPKVATSSLSCVSGRISGQDTCTGEEEKAQGKE